MDDLHPAQPRLGIDIGLVIIDGPSHPDGGDTAFFQGDIDALRRTPAMVGAFEMIPELVRRFDRQVWLVSKCGPRVQERTRRWLEHHEFFARTGIDPAHLRFCLRRPEKAIHCREFAITHFIDDQPEVHGALKGLVTHLYLFGPQPKPAPQWLTPVLTWADASRAVLESLEVNPAGDKPAT